MTAQETFPESSPGTPFNMTDHFVSEAKYWPGSMEVKYKSQAEKPLSIKAWWWHSASERAESKEDRDLWGNLWKAIRNCWNFVGIMSKPEDARVTIVLFFYLLWIYSCYIGIYTYIPIYAYIPIYKYTFQYTYWNQSLNVVINHLISA